MRFYQAENEFRMQLLRRIEEEEGSAGQDDRKVINLPEENLLVAT
jgi:hypothetical protein